MTEDDVTYYTRRAAIEYERAAKATKPEVMRVHQILATVYRDRVATVQPQSRIDSV